MNYQTLHLCNINEIQSFNDYQQLVTINDAIIFYGNHIGHDQWQKLTDLFINYDSYFLINNNKTISTITFDHWVDLVEKYHRTFTWK